MKLNKKVIESMTVTASLVVMSTVAAFGGSTEDSIQDVTRSVALGKNGTAGVIFDLQQMESETIDGNSMLFASIEKTQKDIVTQSGVTQAIAPVSLQEAVEQTEPVAPETTANPEVAATVQVTAAPETIVDIQGTVGTTAEGTETTAQAAMAQDVTAGANPEQAVSTTETTQNQVATTTGEVPEQTVSQETGVAADLGSQAELAGTKAAAQPETPEEAEWANRVMADVEEDMNIRTAPDANAELAGKFYRGDVADVVSVEGEWTQISSGNVTGYVKNEYLVYGMEANALANEVCSLYATVDADALRLRSEPSEEADVVKTAADGDKLKVDKEAEPIEGWVAIEYYGSTAYVSAEYVDVALNLGTALNKDEVAEKEAEEAGITKKPAMDASVDEVTLLGALIQCEAGNGSYEGMLAVGSVVMNRVRSGAYPGSISGVIYQSGQFPPALNGSVAGVMSRGVSSSCMRAAEEALSGIDNTNGALSFRSASSGHPGTVIGANVFF